MPLTLQVGVSKKIGQPDFGSRGANCQIAIEVEQSLLQSDAEAFGQRLKQLFLACRRAVDEELRADQVGVSAPPNGEDVAAPERRQAAHGPARDGAPHNGAPHNGAPHNGAPHNGAPHNGSQAQEPPRRGGGNGQSPADSRSATPSQVRAIRAIAGRQGLNLAGLLQERFGVARPDELSLPDASSLIDELKTSAPDRAPSGAARRGG